MNKKYYCLFLILFAFLNGNAQLGASSSFTGASLGVATIGESREVGKSSLPLCTPSTASCFSVPYTFIGNGNWNIESNWLGNLIPPVVLPSGKKILINPTEGGECILNVAQVIAAGAELNIPAGRRLRVVHSLLYEQ